MAHINGLFRILSIMQLPVMKMFDPSITCCYLYIISKYGYPPSAENTIAHLQEMKSIGFSSIELEGIRKEHLLNVYNQRLEINEALQRLEQTVPYFCIVLPGLGSIDVKERNENLKLFEKGCEIAALLGAKGVLDNAPLPPYQFSDDIPIVRHYDSDILLSATLPPNLSWKNYWNDLVETYKIACDIAGNNGLTYQMHPCAGVLSATTDAFLHFADAVDQENLRFNFDTANQFFMRDNLMLSLIRLSDYVDYIHISDNDGSRIEHLVPGNGMINWDNFFDTLHKIDFKGHIGVDIGGEESDIVNIGEAYISTAGWLEQKWITKISDKKNDDLYEK